MMLPVLITNVNQHYLCYSFAYDTNDKGLFWREKFQRISLLAQNAKVKKRI